MAGDGAGDVDHTAHSSIDAESGELLVVKGSVASGNYEVVGKVIQNVFIRGRDGHEAKVTVDGGLHVYDDQPPPEIHSWDQLTAAGVTPWFDTAGGERNGEVAGNRYHTFAVTLAAVDTSVSVRVEGSIDGANPFNLNDAGVDTTYTANGTFLLHKGGFRCRFVRFNFVGEVGGAAATLNVSYWGGR